MSATRISRTLVQGIYRCITGVDAAGAPTGFVIVKARIGSGAELREQHARFPLVDADGLPYSKKNCGELIKCRLQLLEDLRRTRATDGSMAGTLGAAIDAWRVAHPVTKGATSRRIADFHDLLAHWRQLPLAAVPVPALTRRAIRAELDAWSAAGSAPTTVNHRKRALAAVLGDTRVDEDVVLPTDLIPNVPPKPLEARGIQMPIVARILASLPDHGRATPGGTRPPYSETKIRLTVIAWTGLAHQSLVRVERRHVDFREGKLFLPPRKKGRGAAGLWMDLLPPAIAAFRQYDAAGLWGRSFSRSSMYKSWQRAVTNTRRALIAEAERSGDHTMLEQFMASVPDHCRPYDLRHSFLSDAYRQSGDIRAVQAIAQHADLKTTERYTHAAVPERVAHAIDHMRASWFPGTPKPKPVVRAFQVVPKASH